MDVDDIIEAGERWLQVQENARGAGLSVNLSDIMWNQDLLRRAWELLMSDAPLAETYLNGGRAGPPPHTPRQVLALSYDERKRIDHHQEVYHRILGEVREELERHGPRQCGGLTRDGDECRGYALPYNERPRCHHHSEQGDIERNKQLLGKEERIFHDRLRKELA